MPVQKNTFFRLNSLLKVEVDIFIECIVAEYMFEISPRLDDGKCVN